MDNKQSVFVPNEACRIHTLIVLDTGRTLCKMDLILKYTPFFIRIYFIRISRLKFAKFKEYFNNKAEVEILKRIDIILCVE